MGSTKNKRTNRARDKKDDVKDIIAIKIELLRTHVIIGNGVPLKACFDLCNKQGCSLDDKWLKDVESTSIGANGLCVRLGKDNRDVFVWIKNKLNRASRLSEYGILMHELFHAVQHLQKDIGAEDEREFGAYLFEFLFKKSCAILWTKS